MALPAGAAAVAPAPIEYEFVGDKGTRCVVEVGARATDGINGLQLPSVGFSADPQCTYAGGLPTTGAPGGSLSAGGAVKGAKKKCRAKAKRRGKKVRCKQRRRKRVARGAAAGRVASRVDNPATMQGKLFLLTLLGIPYPGDRTLLSLALGYSCTLDPGTDCADEGNLVPALPLVSHVAEFSATISPPAGEVWVSQPAGCAASCVMRSTPVTPTLG